jgi:hypothetical protein
MDKDEILKWLERKGSRRNIEGMARYGIHGALPQPNAGARDLRSLDWQIRTPPPPGVERSEKGSLEQKKGDSGEIQEIDPPRRLVLSWRNEFIPELRAEATGRNRSSLGQFRMDGRSFWRA